MSIKALRVDMAPSDVLDYSFEAGDWSIPVLTADPLSSATVTIAPVGTLTAGAVTVTGTRIRSRMQGGTAGQTYTVTVKGTTVGAQVFTGYYFFMVQNGA